MKKIITLFAFLGIFATGFSQSVNYDNYRSSISDVNWTTVVADLVLNPQQKNELFALNKRYTTYDSWDNKYRNNPDSWRIERYSEIERIMGSNKYTKFKNNYYKGQNPVAVYNRNKAKSNNKVYRANKSVKYTKGKKGNQPQNKKHEGKGKHK